MRKEIDFLILELKTSLRIHTFWNARNLLGIFCVVILEGSCWVA